MCDTPVSERICGFFGIEPGIDRVHIESSGFVPDCVICADIASPQLLGKYEGEYFSPCEEQNKIDIVIDHHYTNQLYGKYNYIDETACATGQIVFELAKMFDIEIDKRFASDIYCALVCDSGSFRYASTSPKTHHIAAELISTGFDFAKLNRLIFQNKTLTQIASERLAYNSLKFYCDGKAAAIIITSEMKREAGLDGIEIEGISEISKSIAGIEVGITMKEKEYDNEKEKAEQNAGQADEAARPKEFKVSLRSNEYINVAEIAAHFGGGGHYRAAGCKIRGDAAEAERQIISMIEKAFADNDDKLRRLEEEKEIKINI